VTNHFFEFAGIVGNNGIRDEMGMAYATRVEISQRLTSPDAVPAGLSAADWSSIQQQLPPIAQPEG
jgi:hypothetical protein